MAKVLLIQPHQDRSEMEKEVITFTPLSLVYLGTAIEDKHQIKIYDRNIYNDDERFVKFLQHYKPDIIGITSVVSTMLFDVMHLGKLIKKIDQKITLIIGGVQATVDPDAVLNEPYVDYIMRGEGEEAFLEFCDTFDKDKKILGKLRNVNKNPLRPFIDMNKLKLPNYNLLELEKYEKFYVNLSRGCIANCKFCYNVQMWGNKGCSYVRSYSRDNIIKLFENVVEKYKRKVFWIVDDNFLLFKNICIEACNFLKKYNVHFWAPARADCVNEEILIALKSAGCHTIAIGVESGSQRVLDFLNKNVTVEQNAKAIQLCKKHGVTTDALIMLGLPTETREELQETIDFVKKYKPDIASAHMYNPMPAELFDYCVEKGLVTKPITLEEWANFGGLFRSNHNVSDASNEDIQRAVEELEDFEVFQKKIKRLLFWVKAGQIKYALRTVKRNISGGYVNPLRAFKKILK